VWSPPVLSCSALTKKGLPEVESTIEKYFTTQQLLIQNKRSRQGLDWMWQLIHEGLKDHFIKTVPSEDLKNITDEILRNQLSPTQAAEYLLSRFKSKS
jgi:LAO/AO transport system kinase